MRHIRGRRVGAHTQGCLQRVNLVQQHELPIEAAATSVTSPSHVGVVWRAAYRRSSCWHPNINIWSLIPAPRAIQVQRALSLVAGFVIRSVNADFNALSQSFHFLIGDDRRQP